MTEITPDRTKLIEALKTANIFHYLSDKELEEIIGLSQFYSYDADEVIIDEGDVSSYLFVITKGITEVYVHNEVGNDIFICTIGRGDVFGEAAVFLDVKRTAKIIAKDEVEVLRISRTKFVHYIKYYPSAGIKILTLIIYSLIRKLREANQDIAFERANTYQHEEVDTLIQEFLNTGADIIGTPRVE
ncbi:MAG: hypothetical protein A2014_04015 [Spirochaetes bacterium GWF1_49_6]|jgi:CRP-like cAMP-binding protein|nr:MAG: hypothetical protein A2014_04015 [Spirochaetes bacterium GWF1_49_6]